MTAQRQVLAGLASGPTDRWTYAMTLLEEKHFTDDERKLFKLYREMWRRTGTPITGPSIRTLLADISDAATRLTLTTLVDEVEALTLDEPAWRFACHHIQELQKKAQFQRLMTDALEINARGMTVSGRQLAGREAAIEFLLAKLPDLEANPNIVIQDAAQDADEALEEYARAKLGGQRLTRTHIKAIDNEISGMEPGDLMAVMGFTGEGKTMLCGSISHNVVTHGGNVLYCTTETVPSKIKRRFVCCHSTEPHWKRPLSYNQLKHGTLAPDMEDQLRLVVQDIKRGRADGRYGAFKVLTIQTLDDVRQAIRGSKRELGQIDFVVVDYLALAAKTSDRVALVDAIKNCKMMATNEGVPIATPWQTSIEAWQKAQKTGGYQKASMAETAEIERTSDFVLTMLRDPDTSSLLCKFTKCRDEADNRPFTLEILPDFSYVGDPRGGRMNTIRL